MRPSGPQLAAEHCVHPSGIRLWRDQGLRQVLRPKVMAHQQNYQQRNANYRLREPAGTLRTRCRLKVGKHELERLRPRSIENVPASVATILVLLMFARALALSTSTTIPGTCLEAFVTDTVVHPMRPAECDGRSHIVCGPTTMTRVQGLKPSVTPAGTHTHA